MCVPRLAITALALSSLVTLGATRANPQDLSITDLSSGQPKSVTGTAGVGIAQTLVPERGVLVEVRGRFGVAEGKDIEVRFSDIRLSGRSKRSAQVTDRWDIAVAGVALESEQERCAYSFPAGLAIKGDGSMSVDTMKENRGSISVVLKARKEDASLVLKKTSYLCLVFLCAAPPQSPLKLTFGNVTAPVSIARQGK